MQPSEVARRLEELEAVCRRRALPVTAQRRCILEEVLQRDDHPSADQIYEAVKKRLPGLSRTTVYRVLDMLVQFGLIRRLHHPAASTRFDGKIHRHHHLICRQCDRVIDIETKALAKLPLPRVRTRNFQIEDYSVQFIGICAECRKQQDATI